MALANTWAQDGNAAAAVRALIELRQLKDCVVTADALHCRRDTAAALIARPGDYARRSRPTSPSYCGPPSGRRPQRAANRPPARPSAPSGRLAARKAGWPFVAAAAAAPELNFPGLKGCGLIRSKRGADQTVERY
jgi:hypothetical protein